MSEEENKAIEKVKEVIRIDKERRIVTIYDEKPLFRDQLQIIIDLIDKQQKEIEAFKEKDKKHNMHIVYGGRRFGTEEMIVKDYISKDKIREKIEELENLSKNITMQPSIYNYEIDLLKELLEEN